MIIASALSLVLSNASVNLSRLKTFDTLHIVATAGALSGSKFAACLESGEVRIFDAAKGRSILTLTGHAQPAYGVAFSPDGKYLVTGDEQAKIFVWDASNGKKLREFSRDKGHGRGIQSIAFAASGKQFLTVGKDDAIKVWNFGGGNPTLTILGEPANFYGASFNSSNAILTGTLSDGFRIYAPKMDKPLVSLVLPGGQGANSFASNKAGTIAVTGGRDGQVGVWDVAHRQRLALMPGHTDVILDVAVSPNGQYAATASSDATVRVWNIKSYQSVAELVNQSHAGAPVSFTGDGRFLISANDADQLTIYTISPAMGSGGSGGKTVKRKKKGRG